MTLPNRKDVRDSLVANFKTDILVSGNAVLSDDGDGFAHARDHFPKDLGGRSPIAGVDGASVQYDLVGDETAETPFGLIVGFWARSMESRTDAEDMLDTLAQQLATLLRAKYNANFSQPSITDFEVVDGIEYKFELHYVEIYW